MNVERITVDS